MARYRGPQSKIARKFGEPIFGPDKALEKKNYPPEFHGLASRRRKKSEYGLQLKEKQINVSLAQVVEELAKRDARDIARTHAPLKPAEDAVQIDTTGLSIVQVFNIVLKLIDKRLNGL